MPVTAYDAGVVTVTEGSDEANGFYSGGIIKFGDDTRTISKHVGDSLTLVGSFPALAAEIADSGTASVTIAPGCDKSTSTCLDRFDNIKHHLGFPVMRDNPFIKSVF